MSNKPVSPSQAPLDSDERAFVESHFENATVYVVEDSEQLTIEGSDENVVVYVAARAKVFLKDVRTGPKLKALYLLQEESKLTVIRVQDETTPHITQLSRLKAGAHVHVHNVSLGGEGAEQSVVSELVGDHARSDIDWIFYAKESQKQNISARNIFNAKSGEGEITMKGVAENKANVACNGMIEIGLQGGGTDTYLTEDVLMLDPTAKVDAIPGLEIKTNDVKASHSATVSRITAEDLFYFAARGIPEAVGRQMFVEGFLSDLAQAIPLPEEQEVVKGRILAMSASADFSR